MIDYVDEQSPEDLLLKIVNFIRLIVFEVDVVIKSDERISCSC